MLQSKYILWLIALKKNHLYVSTRDSLQVWKYTQTESEGMEKDISHKLETKGRLELG